MNIIREIKKLKDSFDEMLKKDCNNISEEKIRSGYINKLLELFGWNISDISQIIEEKNIQGNAKLRLQTIQSPHTKPDYQLMKDGVLRIYLDAKSSNVNFTHSKEIAFQIRSYGWSSELNISMVSNFNTFGIYDTTFKPEANMNANYKAFFFTIDDLINNFDLYSQFFEIDVIQKSAWNLSPFDINFKDGDFKSFDDDFLTLINAFRISLGKDMYNKCPNLSMGQINYSSQVIINRILFIRVLEDLGLEPFRSLYGFLNKATPFWENFQKKSEDDFLKKYDGALFSEKLPNLKLSNVTFNDFIDALYTNSPYRFDVIKPSLIAEIYDTFLGCKLALINGTISLQRKLLSPVGSVPTPSDLALYICEKTFSFNTVSTFDELLEIKVIDPCVGSGTFLVESLDLLTAKAKELIGKDMLDYGELKSIVSNCLHGVDIDDIALEVLKMTISLKLVTTKSIIEEPIENLLSEFSNNFCLGNTIIQNDAVSLHGEELFQMPTNYETLFPEIMKKGGFDVLVSNPPYIEPKHFKEYWPFSLLYLKSKYISKSGKSDISLFFIERFFSLVNDNGSVGFVTQKRFFKTEYGINIKEWFAQNGYINEIVDFQSNKLFKGKITYVACIIGSRKYSKEFTYENKIGEPKNVVGGLTNFLLEKNDLQIFSTETLNTGVWSKSYLIAAEIIEEIKKENQRPFITINESKEFDIIVGPQLLDVKYFSIKEIVSVSSDAISFTNRLGETHKIEKKLIRKVLRNYHMRPFENIDNSNLFNLIIFPYDKESNIIKLDIMKSKFPLAYKYFEHVKLNSSNRMRIENEFYRFTREQNHNSYNRPKVFFPMTAKRIIASYSDLKIFGDNSNVNALISINDDKKKLLAYTSILNSEMFSLLAICLSGEASGNYRKLNKQFSGSVILPILTKEEIEEFSEYTLNIEKLRKEIDSSYGERRKRYIEQMEEVYDKINNNTRTIYNISDKNIQVLKKAILEIGIEESEIKWV